MINSRVIYLRYSENGTLYEHFAEVQVVDEARGEIDFFLHRIRVNGKFMGFDSRLTKPSIRWTRMPSPSMSWWTRRTHPPACGLPGSSPAG